MNRFAIATIIVAIDLAATAAFAANCNVPVGQQVTDNCINARIQSILVGWDAPNTTEPHTVKVRFDTLTSLGCNFQSSYNEIVLWSNDPAFDTKYSALLTAYSLGKPVWFYVKSTSSSVACEFRTVILY